MRQRSTKKMIELATEGKGQIARIVAGCVEVGIVVPSLLRTALEEAGCTVTYHEGPGENAKEGDHPHGAWVLIKATVEGATEPEVVARAYSENKAEALLHAVYAWLKEEAGVVDKGIVTV